MQTETGYNAATVAELTTKSTEDLIRQYKRCRLEYSRGGEVSAALIAEMGVEAGNIEDVLEARGISNEEIRALWKASQEHELAEN